MTDVLSIDGHVASIRLPGGLLDAATARELSTTADGLIEDRNIRVVVVTSGKDFCAGAAPDLDCGAVDPVAALSRLRVPVVVAITGRCVSVGLELALAADIRLASVDAEFSSNDVIEGRLPMWGGTQRLPRAVGHARATWLLMTGGSLDAVTAAEWGIVHEVNVDLDAAVATTVNQLLAAGPLALELAKEAVHRGSEVGLRDGLRLEGDLNHQLAATADRAEGLAAFFAKRPPDFAGR